MEGLRKLMFTFLFALCLLKISVQAKNFTYCAGENNDYVVKIEDVTISPEPIDNTKPWTITATASSGDKVFDCKDKTLSIVLGIDGTGDQKFELCNKISKTGPSSFVITHTQDETTSVPEDIYLWVSNGDDEFDIVTCIYLKLKNSPKIGHILLPSES